jgi:hypothetical protein
MNGEPGTGGAGVPAAGGIDAETLAAVTALYREHAPQWAVWPPLAAFGVWTAVRVAGSRAPGPELPMVWVTAGTATELSARMRQADGALRPPGR